MTWIFVGTLLGSIVTSPHDTREACEGRATILREKGAAGQCVQAPTNFMTLTPTGCITISCSNIAR